VRARGLVVLAVLALGAWAAVALTSRHGGDAGVAERPSRLLNAERRKVERITVTDPATGRAVTLTPADRDRLARDLAPLLAVRDLPTVRPEYGLDHPSADVVVETSRGPEPALHLGGTNFDRTGYYVAVDGRRGAAVVLMRVGDAVLAALRP
jgi:hypothetical protein